MPPYRNYETQTDDSVLARFVLGFEEETLPPELASYLEHGLAGVALFHRNFRSVEHLRDLTTSIRQAAGRPILIGIDQEGGTRFALKEPFTVWPSAAELGRLRDLNLIHKVANAIARELRAVGCNADFAPMLDLHVNPESPVTKDRSFGSDPQSVGEMGAAFHRGLLAGGVLSCAKHFPGHGDAQVDPHLDLPVFGGTRERLESAELVPFRAAVHAGVPLVMTAHILLPRIDLERPASLSPILLDGVLRQGMGYDGVILADDLGMGAIARRYGPGEAAVATLAAGADMAMLCHDWSAVAPALAEVSEAYEHGRLKVQQTRASLKRIERVCSLAESGEPQPPLEIIGCAEHRALAAQIRARTKSSDSEVRM